MTTNDWHFIGTAVVLAVAFLAILSAIDWAESKARDWSKKRFGEGSLTYRLLFWSPFRAVRPFNLTDHLSRQQADRLYSLPLFIFLTLPFVTQGISRQTRQVVVAVVSLFVTISIFYFWSGRKNFKKDPNYQPRFSVFRFLAENMRWSREKADRTFLRAVPIFIALMAASVPIQRFVVGREIADVSRTMNVIALPLMGLTSLFYVFRHRKRFKPESVTADDSPFAFLHDPQFRRAAAHGIARTAVPLLVFCSLIAVFVPDDPRNPLSRFTVQTIYWGVVVFVISLPSVAVHSWVRDTIFGSRHRFLVAFLAWLVPPTLMYLTRYPTGMRKDLEFAPIVSSIWFFTSFCGAAVLAYAMLSGKAPKTFSTESELVADRQGLDLKDRRSIRSLRNRLTFVEIFGLVSGVASIVGLIWTVAQDVAR